MGLTVLDAGVVIGLLDGDDAHHAAALRALQAARRAGETLVFPASAYAEALVEPSRRGPRAVAAVQELVDRTPLSVQPLDAAVAQGAARLRARHRSLRLPDALVIATAVSLDADRLITTDHRWPPRSRLGLRGALIRL